MTSKSLCRPGDTATGCHAATSHGWRSPLGPRYPARSSMGDQIKAAERFVALAPDSPEAWYTLGDNLFHLGALAGIRDNYQRARAAFDRSLSLDSSYAPTLQHLSSIAAGLGDTAGVRRALELLRSDSVSPNAVARRWHVAAFLGDTAGIRRALSSDSALVIAPRFVLFYALENALDLRGTEEIYPRARAQSATADERQDVEHSWYNYELIRGRPGRAPQVSGASSSERLQEEVLNALFANGDSARGVAAAKALEPRLGKPLAGLDPDEVLARYAVGQYGVASGQLELARRASADLRSIKVKSDSAWLAEDARTYALLLETQVAAAQRHPTAGKLLRQLDSLLADPVSITWSSYGNLIAARLHEERGEIPAALAAVRRRYVGVAFPHYVRYLREEGRLAALAGDRRGAIRAYRHYLALRGEAEPALQPEVRAVKAELEAIERESTDR